MTQESFKILVVGDVCGEFNQLAKRLRLMNQKAGPFECALCVGDFFGEDPLANKAVAGGRIDLCVPTYILGPSTSDATKYFAQSHDIAPNLTYLGSKGTLTLACGATVAYLSGIESVDSSLFTFDGKTVTELIESAQSAPGGFTGVDVLLSSQWPADVWKFDGGKLSFDPKSVRASDEIARAATALRPRYHFAGRANIFYARQPYRNHRVLQEAANHVTRFVGLASLSESLRDKTKRSFYAFNLAPMKHLLRDKLVDQPPDTTEFPYDGVLVRLHQKLHKGAQRGDGSAQFFYDMTAPMEDEDEGDRRKGRRGRKRGHDSGRGGGRQGGPGEPPAPCWFCLSNAEVEKHLVISIGTHAYVALAKGGLTDDHVLILPIDHVQSISAASEELLEEVDKFKRALVDCSKSAKKRVVFFERNFKTQHFQIQCVPISGSVEPSTIAKAFDDYAEIHNINLATLPQDASISSVISEGNPYFWTEFGSEAVSGSATVLFSPIKDRSFPVQFGREVLAGPRLLNVPDKSDWRNCKGTKEEEFDLAKKLRDAFAPFDFTEEDEDD